MGESKKTARCPACGTTWHIDTKIKERVIICPNCGRVDFTEYFLDEVPGREKEGYKSKHPVHQKSVPPKSQQKPESQWRSESQRKLDSQRKTVVRTNPSGRLESKVQKESSFSLTSDCFIVTATYGTSSYEKLAVFYRFRDNFLMKSSWGRVLTRIYYRISPFFAYLIRKSRTLRGISVILLDRLADLIQKRL